MKKKCYETVVLKMKNLKYFKLHNEEYDFFPLKKKAFYILTAQHVFMALEYLKQKWKQTNKQKPQNTTRVKLFTNTARYKLL